MGKTLLLFKSLLMSVCTVSYTHLDVYKRQVPSKMFNPSQVPIHIKPLLSWQRDRIALFDNPF